MILFEAKFNDTSSYHHKCRLFPANGSAAYDIAVGNIFVPGEFDYLAFKHGLPVTHNPQNTVGWSQPEGHHESIAQYPDRVDEGFAAWMAFGFYRIIDLALVKRLVVPSKGKLIIRCHVHAWSSRDDDPRTSEGVGDNAFDVPAGTPGLTDDQRNITFWCGATNNSNPFNSTLGEGHHIYNKYGEINLTLPVTAGELDVFVRAQALWEFKHNNVYFDAFIIEFIPDEIEPEPCICYGIPREQYKRSLLLLHPTADDTWIQAILASGAWKERRITISGSADDGGIGDLEDKEVLAVRPGDWNGDLAAFYTQYYPGTKYVPIDVETPEQLTEWLEKWLGGENPTPPPNGGSHSSLAAGLHLNTGDSGASDYYKRLRVDLGDRIAPTVKAYGTPSTMATLKLFKDIDSRILTVGRLSQGLNGEDVEGVNLDGDLLQEAQRIMTISMQAWSAHRAYVDVWEIINEQDPVGVDGHRRMAQFFMHCMDIANANGYKIALFSYSLGVPEYDEIMAIGATGCLAQAKRDGHYLALHEYADPLDQWYGTAIPGAPQNDERGPLAFRYRFWEDAAGGKDAMPNTIITEMNVNRDIRTLTAAEWDTQIRWYMTEASKDAYIKGVHLFGWGSLGGAWESFDIQRAGFAETWYKQVLDLTQDDIVIPPEPPTYNVIPFSQRDPLWADDRLGASIYTIGSAGCAMVSATMNATIADPTLTPKIVNAWLSANNGYTPDGLLYWKRVADFVDGMEFNEYIKWSTGVQDDLSIVLDALEKGPCVLQVDFYPGGALNTHFIFALYAQDNDIYMIDPWTGEYGWLLEKYGTPDSTLNNAIFAMARYTITVPPQEPTLLGFNDHPDETGTAASWMIANNLKGLIVRPLFIGGAGSALDFTLEEENGLRIIINLRYSWSTDEGGAGTMPVPYSTAWYDFIDACVLTINQSRGVWGFEICNEMNNPREWPSGNAINASNVVALYNAIRLRVVEGKRMAPGALDPFNAQAGDPRAWLSTIYTNISGADFVTAHGYIRGPQPELVNSTAMFTDEPLRWQYLNYYRCVNALLESLPSHYYNHPVYITEFNHLYKTIEGDWGWIFDSRASSVIDSAYAQAQAQRYAGLALYRWSGDAWQVSKNPYVLDAVYNLTR